jgi:hypothetical protein
MPKNCYVFYSKKTIRHRNDSLVLLENCGQMLRRSATAVERQQLGVADERYCGSSLDVHG